MIAKVKITIYKQFFTVLDLTGDSINFSNFNFRFNTFNLIYDKRKRRYMKSLHKQFVGYSNIDNEYRYPINALNEFAQYLKGTFLDRAQIQIEKGMPLSPSEVDIKIRNKFKSNDMQKPIVDKIVNNKSNSILINIQTGKGKTVIACNAFNDRPYRPLVLIKPKYILKWIDDFIEKTNVKKEEIYIIKGSASLNSLIKEAKEDELPYKVIITSSSTIRNHIKNYETSNSEKELIYDCIPQETTQILGIGDILIDEAHEEFYNAYKILLYYNANLVIGLSATMIARDKDLRRMHRYIFPSDNIIELSEYHKYVNIIGMGYKLNNVNKIERLSKQSGMYNHIKFEEALLNDGLMAKNYFNMIDDIMIDLYISKAKKNRKCAIFVASVRMATVLTEYIRRKYPKKTVARYVDDDPYDNVIAPDIRITTVMSSGAAIDIPRLHTVIMTNATISDIDNIQVLGRLREIKGEEIYFAFLYADNFKKHLDYNRIRVPLFNSRGKTFTMRLRNNVI